MTFRDQYYPSEEAAERESILWPQIRESGAVLQQPGEEALDIQVGERYGDWELLAVLPGPESLAVVERSFDRWGLLAYLGSNGPAAVLRKPVGRGEMLRQKISFPPEYFERLIDSEEDILGQQVLAAGEPSYEAVAGLLPPLHSYTFLGTPASREKIILMPDGRLGEFPERGGRKELSRVLFDPWEMLEIPGESRPEMTAKQGLLGGCLPVIVLGFFDPSGQQNWEQIAFSSGDEELQVYIRLRSLEGKRFYWQLFPLQRLEGGTAFYRELLALHRRWERFFAKGMDVKLPEPRVMDASRAGIVRAMIAGVGFHPKYGVGSYGASIHDGFPPTTLSLAACLMEWGFGEEAKGRLGYYLSRFVKEDGTFNYYGPAVTEYGQMLSLSARCVQLTKDKDWLIEHLPALKRIGGRLLAERETAGERISPGDPHYGLLWGAAEADTFDEQSFYFSGDIWCWRGLLEMGSLMAESGWPEMQAAGERWQEAAAAYRQDILTALERVLKRDAAPHFLPPAVGLDRPFERMTEDAFASYTNYRYWLEMLSAGLLTPEMRDAILDYRITRGGELLGTTRFLDRLDDWPYAHYAWGLLEAGRRDHFLLGFYSHLAHHQTPGTFTAYEQVPIRGNGSRDYVADYCVPTQLVTPMMLRWMLVWEEWDRNILHLAYAVPEKWFSEGFSIHGVPTRWGAVSLEVSPHGDGLTARIETASPAEDMKIHLHLRFPDANTFRQLHVEGAEQWEWEPESKSLSLSGVSERVLVEVG